MSSPKPFVSSILNLDKSLQSHSHPRLVSDLSISYRYCHGHSSQEIRDTIPVPLRRVRTTRSSTHSHPFQVSLPNRRTLTHKSSFIPRTCSVWSVLHSSSFPTAYNLSSFKTKINKPDMISQPFKPSLFPLEGLCGATRAFRQHNLLKKK